jgi:hypothetical protein
VHCSLLSRLNMIPPAEMQRTVHRQQSQLLSRGPAHVARLPASAALGLSDCAFHRDDDVAQMRSATGWERKAVRRPRPGGSSRPSRVRGKRRRRQKREGEHVGRFSSAGHTLVQLRQLAVIGEDETNGRWFRGARSRQCRRNRASKPRCGDDARRAGPNREIGAPGRQVQRAMDLASAAFSCVAPRAQPTPESRVRRKRRRPLPAARRDSSSTILFCGYSMRR